MTRLYENESAFKIDELEKKCQQNKIGTDLLCAMDDLRKVKNVLTVSESSKKEEIDALRKQLSRSESENENLQLQLKEQRASTLQDDSQFDFLLAISEEIEALRLENNTLTQNCERLNHSLALQEEVSGFELRAICLFSFYYFLALYPLIHSPPV